MLLLWLATASASSLDLLEVGGAWGTPAATGPTAVWFNPAAMSFEHGTRVLIEVAPTMGTFSLNRAEPSYDWTAPRSCGDDPSAAWCTRPVLGGPDRARFVGAVPFLGVVSDLGVRGLGVGAALFVPHARGGAEVDEPGTMRTHLRAANIQAIYSSVGVSWAYRDLFGVGAAATWVHSTWYAHIDNQTATSYRDYPVVGDLLASELSGTSIEDPALLVDTEFGPKKLDGRRSGALRDDTASFQIGLYARPHRIVSVSLGYAHGARVDHRGDVSLDFSCPDSGQYPLLGGPLGAPNFGVCNASMRGKTTVGYRYPMRVNLGIAIDPLATVRVELMGGWVRWSQYTDFEITVTEVQSTNTTISPETAALLTLDRKWARDNRDTFWAGVDTKGHVHRQVELGGRLIFDHHAVPSSTMSPNNADFDSVIAGALLAVQPSVASPVRVGLSYSGTFSLPRLVTDSAFRVDVNPEDRAPDRYMYPEMNGRYTAQVHRLGVSLLGTFGGVR